MVYEPWKNNRQKYTSSLEVWNQYTNRILYLNYSLHNAKMFWSGLLWNEGSQHPVLTHKSVMLCFSLARTTGWVTYAFSHWIRLLVLAVIAKTSLCCYFLACSRKSKHHINNNNKTPLKLFVDYFECAMNLIILKYLFLLKSMDTWMKRGTGCNYWVFISSLKRYCIIVASRANTYSRYIPRN